MLFDGSAGGDRDVTPPVRCGPSCALASGKFESERVL